MDSSTLSLLIPILGILTPIAIVAIVFSYKFKSEARFHATAQKLIENGQTLDEATLSGIPGYQGKQPRDDLRSGFITAAVGLGVTLLGWVALGSVVKGAGLLVLCIGVALFSYAHATKDKTSNSAD